VEVRVNPDALARLGMTAQDVLSVVEAGLGGKTVTAIPAISGASFAPDPREASGVRGTPALSSADLRNGSQSVSRSERIPVQVRLERSEREDLTRLKDVLVIAADGKAIPLGQLAEIVRVQGPNEIASENGQLRAYVQANVSGHALGGFVNEVRTRLEKELAPQLAAQGMTLEYCGEYENQIHTARTLMFIVPCVVAIIFVLLLKLYGSFGEAAHVLLAVPFALSGGFFLQYALGWHFSAAVWVGYIALFGTAIQTAVVMVVYLREAVERKQQQLGASLTRADLISAVKEGARLRLRPKIMTVATIIAGLLPIMWSHRTGSEIIQPIATPILGGMISSLLHILILTPVLFLWMKEREIAD
jgi:Cu(I)/Ag(I) efflux system membrane protein CusA/SilA